MHRVCVLYKIKALIVRPANSATWKETALQFTFSESIYLFNEVQVPLQINFLQLLLSLILWTELSCPDYAFPQLFSESY